MTRHRSNTPAERFLAEMLKDAISDYDCPTDHLDRPIMDASHFAAHLADYIAFEAELLEEDGQCCPLCDVVRERCEVAA
jgi:hypothetical protein